MINGSRKLLNCAAKTRKMSTNDNAAAFQSAPPSTRNCRD